MGIYSYFNITLKSRNEKLPSLPFKFLTKCKKHTDHLWFNDCNYLDSKTQDDIFGSDPIVIKVYEGKISKDEPVTKYGRDHIYLHVYGIFKYYYLFFKENTPSHILKEFFNPEEGTKRLREYFSGEISGLIYTKLVFKSSSIYTTAGPQWMLKILMNLNGSPPSTIRDLIRNNYTPFEVSCNDSSFNKDIKWTVKERITHCGELMVHDDGEENVKEFKWDKDCSYKYKNVHYKDIDFNNQERFVLNDDIDWENLKNRLEIEIYFYGDGDKNICSLVERLTNIEELVRGKSMKRSDFKSTILNHLFSFGDKSGKLRSRYNLVHRFMFFNKARDEDNYVEEKYNENILKLTKLEFEISKLLKNFWEDVIFPAYFTEKHRETKQELCNNVAEQGRAITFDIETSFKPHTHEVEKCITIATVLKNEGSSNKIHEMVVFQLMFSEEEEDYDEEGAVAVITSANTSTMDFDYESMKKILLKNGFDQIDYDIIVKFYKTEVAMIKDFFHYVKECKISTLISYGGLSFDVPFIEQRLEINGIKPNGTISSKKPKDIGFDGKKQFFFSITHIVIALTL